MVGKMDDQSEGPQVDQEEGALDALIVAAFLQELGGAASSRPEPSDDEILKELRGPRAASDEDDREALEHLGPDPVAGIIASASQDPDEDAAAGWWRVEEARRRFEAEWQVGVSPRIEDYLDAADLPPSRRAALLGELLKAERALRHRRGEGPDPSEYVERFPGSEVIVGFVFGEETLGDYELIRPIGGGDMGVVFRALHRATGRDVALKVIRPQRLGSSPAADWFRLEMQIAARLNQKHIVPVYEVNEGDGRHFYAMRYVPGRNLGEVIGGTPLGNRAAAGYLEQVARAVDYAHTQGVVHGDLKPQNILVDSTDRAYVADFGLSRLMARERGVLGADDLKGTLPYWSPEQVRDPSRIGVACDVYGLGAVLYEALTGGPPFRDGRPFDLARQILGDAPPRPRVLNPGADPGLAAICLRCLEKEPARRYATPLELARELKRWSDGEPIEARRLSRTRRACGWVCGNPLASALVLMGVLQVQILGHLLETHNDPYYRDYRDEVVKTLGRVTRLETVEGSRTNALRVQEEVLVLRRQQVARAPGHLRRWADLAETLHEIGALHHTLGHPSAAEDNYREALSIRLGIIRKRIGVDSGLTDRAPGRAEMDWGTRHGVETRLNLSDRDNRSFLNDLARSYGYFGDLERDRNRDDRGKAGPWYEMAQFIRKILAQDERDLEAKFQLARTYNNSGKLAQEMEKTEEAQHWYREALKIQQELVDLGPAVVRQRLEATNPETEREFADFRADLADTHNLLGVSLGASSREVGKIEDALREHEKAKDIYSSLAEHNPSVIRFQCELAWTLNYLGGLNKSPEPLDQAHDIFERLHRTNPEVLWFRAGLACNDWAFSELARSKGDEIKAQEFRKKATKRREELVKELPSYAFLHLVPNEP
jgi:tetratricopeptide (TPR) repeat protein/predicted Ser/Thr protein kinase